MRIACHGITWGRENFNEAVADIGDMGFTGVETFASVMDDFGFERVNEFSDLLRSRGMQLVGLYGGGDLHDPSKFEIVVANNVRIARFLQLNGAERLVLGPGRRPAQGPTRNDLLNLAHCASEIGRRTHEYGVQACLHPHVHTVLETIPEIDFVFDRVDPRYVAMAADTAHFAKGNPDVPGAELDLFSKYADRIKYVHLKDWDPELLAETDGVGGTAVIRDFVELGEGRVNLAACIDTLRQQNYDGWLTIELDYTRRTPVESVQMSKEYLERELGLSV